jgi:hypothetical protein
LVVVVLAGVVVDADVGDAATAAGRLVPGVRVDQDARPVLLVGRVRPVDRVLRRLLSGDVDIEGGVVLRDPRPDFVDYVLFGGAEARRVPVGVVRRDVDRVDRLVRVPRRTGDAVAVEVEVDDLGRAGFAVQLEGGALGGRDGSGGPPR